MRKNLFITLLAALAVGACSKPKTGAQVYQEPTNNDTTVTVNTPDTSFYVSGLSGIVLKKLGKSSITFNSLHTDGIQRNVKLDVSGVPANMKFELSNTSGYTPFATNAMIDVRFLSAGIYPVTLTAQPDKGETKIYTINLRVDSCSTKECNNVFWDGLQLTFGSLPVPIMVTDSSGKSINIDTRFYIDEKTGQLYISKLPVIFNENWINAYLTDEALTGASMKHLENVVKFNFNCDNGEMTIPTQTLRGIRYHPSLPDTMMFTISGKGMVDLDNNYYKMTYQSDSNTYYAEGVFNY